MGFKWVLIISFFIFKTAGSIAQVVNDNCINASFINIPATGQICLNADNLNATPDGYSNTCDQIATPPLPVGGNEIWYSYIATGDSNIISVTPDGSPGSIVDPSLTVITGNCGAFNTLVCDAALSASVSFTIPAGTQVWFYITANTTDGSFIMCVQSSNSAVSPGDCNNLTRVCNKQSITIQPDLNSASSIVPSCFTAAPQHPQWLIFTVGTTGSFEFTGSPLGWPNGNGGSTWALFEATDLLNPCANPSLLMCNSFYVQNSVPVTQFGMSSSVTGCSTNSFCPPITVDSGKTYLLLIDDINGNASPVDISWGGTFEIGPTADFTISYDFICTFNDVQVNYTGNATSSATFNWTPAQSSNNYTVSYPAAGNYTIRLSVTENGCTQVTGKQITVNPTPVATAGNNLDFCSASGQYLMGLAPVAGYIYNWIPNLNINYPDSSQTLVFGFNVGTTDSIVNYTLIATLGICSDSDEVEVLIHPRQSPLFTVPAAQCLDGNSFSFIPDNDSVPNSTFQWTFDNGNPDTSYAYNPQNISFTTIGQHQITLTTQSPNCPADVYFDVISINPNPVASFYASISSGCPPLAVDLINTSPPLAGGNITWQLGNGLIDTVSQDTAMVVYDISGFYIPTITLTSADGCSTTDTIAAPIEVYPLPNATFYSTPAYVEDLNPLVSFTNSEPNGLCYYTFGDGDSSIDCQTQHLYADTGSYLVTLIVTSTDGCIDTTYRIIEVNKFFTLYIPNAFTPNDDGRNDAFIIKGDGVVDLDIKIFNRRGQMVYRSDALNKAWNGTHLDTGNKVPDGVYVYDMIARDSNRKKHYYKGYVTVVR
jgi:gliding motility-associated-like protein